MARAGPGRRSSPRRSTTPARVMISRSWRSTAARCRNSCSNPNCLAMRGRRFTGAVSNREGLFQAAEGGTLFLDEIGDMPVCVAGESCCASCRSARCARWAATAISKSTCGLSPPPTATCRRRWPAASFREEPVLPPQRSEPENTAALERTEDIPLLANHLLRQSADRHKPFVRAFSSDAMKRLMAAKWPGNVRQLVNVIEQCVALTSSPVIGDALVEQALEGENTALPTFVERAQSV